MNDIIKNLRYGQCNLVNCPNKELSRKDKKIFYSVIKLVNIKQTYDFYEQELYIVKKFQKLFHDLPKYNSEQIFGIKTHYDLSKLEDYNYKSLIKYARYLNKKYNLSIDINYIYKIIASFLDLTLKLKDYINMPRPYQLLPYYPHIKVKVEYSVTSYSGSTPSGHCFAALFIGYLIYLAEFNFFDNNPDEMSRLINISLDIGYHRNMAGIHFLYDNYISYLLFKEIIKVYKYDNKNKYLKSLENKLNKVFKIYQ